ncbi:MAG TPA: ATP-binding protein [Stenomitos sp.]
MSIRLRLTLLFAVLLVGVGVIRSVVVLGGLSGTLWQIKVTDARNKVQQVQDYLHDLDAETSATGGGQLRLDSPDALPRAFSDDGSYLQLTGLDGSILNKSPNLGSQHLPVPLHSGEQAIDLPLPHFFESPRVLLVSEPLVLDHGKVGWVQAAYSLQGRKQTIERLMILELGTLIGSAALALALGFFFAGRALRPVASITSEVRAWTPQDLDRRLSVGPPPHDEIDELALTFNALFDRLQVSFDAQRRFVADASHELKSPLTSIRGHLQLLQRRPEATGDQRTTWIQTGLREVDRLTRLVNELLDLARTEAAPDMRRERVDLNTIAHEVTEQFHVVADRVSEQLSQSALWVVGDPDRLRQALINLVDNAMRATRSGGRVIVRAAHEGKSVLLQVVDTGPGIPPEAQRHLFERFYRVDSARHRDEGGTGLGLAITQAIAQAHGGTLEVQSEPGQGAVFTLRLPAA